MSTFIGAHYGRWFVATNIWVVLFWWPVLLLFLTVWLIVKWTAVLLYLGVRGLVLLVTRRTGQPAPR